MHPHVTAAFAESGGLITRQTALDRGLSPSHVASLLRHGEWVAVRRGVYAEARLWNELDDYRGRPRLRALSAVMTMGPGWVLSHDSAAHVLGMDILRPSEPFVHVTRPSCGSAWTRHGIKHHLARFQPNQVVTVDGVHALNLARTVVDIARERGFQDGAVAADSAMRMGLPRSALVQAYAPMVSWPGITQSRLAVDFADAGAESVAESLGRQLVTGLGIGTPETQFPVRVAGGTAWCDLRVGNHVFEVDGRIKYRSVADGGVATKSAEQVVWDEKERQRLVCAEGLGMSRIVWADFWGAGESRARKRLLAEWDVTRTRFGVELPEHLARFAAFAREERAIRRARGA